MTAESTHFEHTYQQRYRPEAGRTKRVPWDIGRAQPAVVALAEKGAFTGSVLDIGCGLGDNAIHLASRGLNVTGLDSAPSAVRMATERAKTNGVNVEFAVADATSLAGYENRFDTILDSGLYHCLGPDVRPAYVAALARVGRQGARLHLLSFTDELPEKMPSFPVSEANLREHITAPWVIETLTKTRYETALTLEQLREGVNGTVGDAVIGMSGGTGFETDETGKVWFSAWHLVARLT